MTAPARLYTPELLARTLRLAEFPMTGSFPLEGEARSATCGSTLRLGLDQGPDGRITRLGMKAQACAVGQAAAALFADRAIGRTASEIEEAAGQIRAWLANADAARPDWPGIGLLDPARAFPARHGAILLAWDAALRALSNGPDER